MLTGTRGRGDDQRRRRVRRRRAGGRRRSPSSEQLNDAGPDADADPPGGGGAQQAARSRAARVPRRRPRRRAVGAGCAVHLEPRRAVGSPPTQATSPQYWVDHLRNTVRFAENLATVLADGPAVLVELGPGHALSSYARRQEVKPVAAIPALRHPNQAIDDTAASLLAVGRLWAAGVDVDVDQFTGSGRRTVRLPGYPFRRERHWIEPGARGARRARVGTPSRRHRSALPATVPQVHRASPTSPTSSGSRGGSSGPSVRRRPIRLARG